MEKKVLIIVPAYNEEDCIYNTVSTLVKNGYDYIVINDGSKDKTEEILRKNNFNHVELITNLGIGGAVQTGYKYALEHNYDIAVQFDADGQHDVDCIKLLVKSIAKDKNDLVIGSRFVSDSKSEFKSTKLRRIGINLISNIIYIFSKKRVYDATSGFRAVNKEVIKLFANEYPSEYPEPISDFELLKKGYNISEVPVTMYERKGGKSSIASWKNAYYMINVCLSIIAEELRGGNK